LLAIKCNTLSYGKDGLEMERFRIGAPAAEWLLEAMDEHYRRGRRLNAHLARCPECMEACWPSCPRGRKLMKAVDEMQAIKIMAMTVITQTKEL